MVFYDRFYIIVTYFSVYEGSFDKLFVYLSTTSLLQCLPQLPLVSFISKFYLVRGKNYTLTWEGILSGQRTEFYLLRGRVRTT